MRSNVLALSALGFSLSLSIGCASLPDDAPGSEQSSEDELIAVRAIAARPALSPRLHHLARPIATGTGRAEERALVAYYASWTRDVLPVSSIPWDKITHLAHAFVLPAATGGLKSVSGYVDPTLIAAAHANGVKVLASVGGWGASFDANVDSAVRGKTVAAMASLCRTHGYDGIDLDWEFPTDKTAGAWAAMVSELRTALDAIDPELTVSAAVSAVKSNLSVLPRTALEKLSFIGVMTYDYAGPWSATVGHGAPLHPSRGGDGGSVSGSISHLVDAMGIAPRKVFVGLPFYGYEFAGSALGATPVAPSNGIDYRKLAGRVGTGGWVKSFDAGARVPYLTRSASPGFTSYDDSVSIDAKCAFARSRALGGAIVWHLAGDRMADGSQPLLDAAQRCR